MYRFLCDINQLTRLRKPEEVRQALAVMTDYFETRDRDGKHLLDLIDRPYDGVGLDAAKVVRRVERALRMIALGQGREFSRSPTDAQDPGLQGEALVQALTGLAQYARRAQERGEGLAVVNFSSRWLAPQERTDA